MVKYKRSKSKLALTRKSNKAKNFFKEFIIFFGFLNGLWFAIGISPSAEIFNVIKKLIDYLNPGEKISFVFNLIFLLMPTLILILILYTVYKIYNKAKWMGVIAVLLGFIAGTFIIVSPVFALILLAIAFIIGYYSAK